MYPTYKCTQNTKHIAILNDRVVPAVKGLRSERPPHQKRPQGKCTFPTNAK